MLAKLASIFGLVVILMAAIVPVNSGYVLVPNGPCTPAAGSAGICSDDGTAIWYDAAGTKTAFASMVGGKAATIAVGKTTTLAPGNPASVGNSGNAQNAIFDFGIPAGKDGINGTNGTNATLPGQVCHFSISSFSMDGKGNAAGVLTITTCP